MNLNEVVKEFTKYAAAFYTMVKDIVANVLETYVFKSNPELAAKYGEILITLVTATVIYALLEFFVAIRKVVRTLIILGWVIFIIVLIFNALYTK